MKMIETINIFCMVYRFYIFFQFIHVVKITMFLSDDIKILNIYGRLEGGLIFFSLDAYLLKTGQLITRFPRVPYQ